MSEPKETPFWRAYARGALSDLAAFVAAVAMQRQANDASNTTSDRFFRLDELDGINFDAPKRLQFPSLMSSDGLLRRHQMADWQHTHVAIRVFSALLIETCRRRGIPLYVHSAFRTQEQQDQLVAKGRSRTPWPSAAHCQGAAVDIVHGAFHWEMTQAEWRLIGTLGKRCAEKINLDITWGGDWSNPYDPAHWELPNWRNDVQKRPTGQHVPFTPRYLLKEVPQFPKSKKERATLNPARPYFPLS